MIFALIRVLPLSLPVINFLLLKTLFYFPAGWFWFLIMLLALNGMFFCLVHVKKKNKKIFLLAAHSSVFILVGFVFTLTLSNPWFINSFLLVWSLVYLVYLESAFHYFYETRKDIIFDLKNVVNYSGIIVFFLAAVALFNFYLFLGLSWWWILPAVLILSLILLLNRFIFSEFKDYWIHIAVICLIILEFLVVLLVLPFSLYILALLLVLAYYLLSSLAALSLSGGLKARSVWLYSIFVLISAVLVLGTSIWI
ncbi:MAG: hypothetical protein AAB791_01210 [Patescibacteria group bacterium]